MLSCRVRTDGSRRRRRRGRCRRGWRRRWRRRWQSKAARLRRGTAITALSCMQVAGRCFGACHARGRVACAGRPRWHAAAWRAATGLQSQCGARSKWQAVLRACCKGACCRIRGSAAAVHGGGAVQHRRSRGPDQLSPSGRSSREECAMWCGAIICRQEQVKRWGGGVRKGRPRHVS